MIEKFRMRLRSADNFEIFAQFDQIGAPLAGNATNGQSETSRYLASAA
jgi:hypothetical protein